MHGPMSDRFAQNNSNMRQQKEARKTAPALWSAVVFPSQPKALFIQKVKS